MAAAGSQQGTARPVSRVGAAAPLAAAAAPAAAGHLACRSSLACRCCCWYHEHRVGACRRTEETGFERARNGGTRGALCRGCSPAPSRLPSLKTPGPLAAAAAARPPGRWLGLRAAAHCAGQTATSALAVITSQLCRWKMGRGLPCAGLSPLAVGNAASCVSWRRCHRLFLRLDIPTYNSHYP